MTVNELLAALHAAQQAGRGRTPVMLSAAALQGLHGWLTPDTVAGDADRTVISLRPLVSIT